MKRYLCLLIVPMILSLGVACGDDDGPDQEAGVTDGTSSTSDGALPWPDQSVTTPGKCTPGESGMCDDNKNFYCSGGECTQCPANYVDCDRQGDCECYAACDGDQCMKNK